MVLMLRRRHFQRLGHVCSKEGLHCFDARRGLAPDLGFDLLLVTLNAGRKAKIVLTWGAWTLKHVGDSVVTSNLN